MDLGINLIGTGNQYSGGDATPTDAQIDYYVASGFSQIRLPIEWEKLQPTLNGALDPTYLAEIRQVVDYAASRGVSVVLDLHNYGSYNGNLIGSGAVPVSAFANLWGDLASAFKSDSNVAFGLMNEPQLPTASGWLAAINAAIADIRSVGATQEIMVSGAYWDSAVGWTQTDNASVIGAPGAIVDPDHNYAIEVHQYLDDGSGQHSWVVSPTIGVDRLAAITEWARESGVKLYLGEFGVASDQASLTALTNMMNFLQANQDVWQGASYWAGGSGWNNYMYSAEPALGLIDTAQMDVLQKYGNSTVSSHALANGGEQIDTYVPGDKNPVMTDVLNAAGKLVSRTLFASNGSIDKVLVHAADGTYQVTTDVGLASGVTSTVDIYDGNLLHLSTKTLSTDGTSTLIAWANGTNQVAAESYYDPQGHLTMKVAFNSTAGNEVVTHYTGTQISSVETYNSSWALVSRDTYTNGLMSSRQIDGSDGTHTVQQFSTKGVMVTSDIYSSAWQDLTHSTYDSLGNLASVQHNNSNGYVVDTFSPGSSVATSEKYYNSAWQLLSSVATLTNGTHLIDHYTNEGGGSLSNVEVYDTAWTLETRSTYAGDGSLANVQTDTGSGHSIATFDAANQETPQTIDFYNIDWSMQGRVSLNDDGQICAVDAVTDAGGHAVATYAGADTAVPASIETYDAGWNLVSRISFDANGNLSKVQLQLANGGNEIDTFASDGSYIAMREDYSAGWQTEERAFYNAAGQMTMDQTFNADGTISVATYTHPGDTNSYTLDVLNASWQSLSHSVFSQPLLTADAGSLFATDALTASTADTTPTDDPVSLALAAVDYDTGLTSSLYHSAHDMLA